MRNLREKFARHGVVGRLLPALGLALVVVAGGCSREQGGGKKLLLLAIDGMDYTILRGLMEEGKMPNFQRVAAQGGFAPLATTIPPQSPVAWSSFITGMNPGHTAIFDFIHRDPNTMLPYLSTSRVEPAGRTLSFGKWVFPLSGGEAVQLRRGTPWWEILEEHGIPATVVQKGLLFRIRRITGLESGMRNFPSFRIRRGPPICAEERTGR